MKQITERLWTIEDVAEYCRVKQSVVKYWVRNTDIPYIKLGKHIRFTPNEVEGWLDKHRNKGTRISLQVPLSRIAGSNDS